MSSDDHFKWLPYDLKSIIFEYLEVKDRIRLERVCRAWQQDLLQVWKQQKVLAIVDTPKAVQWPWDCDAVHLCLSEKHHISNCETLKVGPVNTFGVVASVLRRSPNLKALYLILDDCNLKLNQKNYATCVNDAMDEDGSREELFGPLQLFDFSCLCSKLEHFYTSSSVFLEKLLATFPTTLVCLSYKASFYSRLFVNLFSQCKLKHFSCQARSANETLFKSILKISSLEELHFPDIERLVQSKVAFQLNNNVGGGEADAIEVIMNLQQQQQNIFVLDELKQKTKFTDCENIVTELVNLKAVNIKWMPPSYIVKIAKLEAIYAHHWTSESYKLVLSTHGQRLKFIRARYIDTKDVTLIAETAPNLVALDLYMSGTSFLPATLLSSIHGLKSFKVVVKEIFGEEEFFMNCKALRKIEIGDHLRRQAGSFFWSLIEFARWHPNRTIHTKLFLNSRLGFHDCPINLVAENDISVA